VSGAVSAIDLPPAIYAHAISVAIPSLDTGRGIDANYERGLDLPGFALLASGELRESATGDYTGVRIGAGVELRWYWRAERGAWLSRLGAGNLAGWFAGAAGFIATDATHDDADHRWLGTALQIGTVVHVGYRIAPWRALAITPSAGIELHHDMDLSGRLPGYTLCYPTFGLDVGWMF
jgi:hypothetical protein